jgi:small subunit ribosomal protein S13
MRVAGVNIPSEKRIEIALTSIYGVGHSLSNKILRQSRINPDIRVKDLKDEETKKLREIIEKNYKIEGELRRGMSMNIKRLKEINCYRGERHKKNLPTRGQRTKTNARTKRGKKVTVSSGRRKSPEKT